MKEILLMPLRLTFVCVLLFLGLLSKVATTDAFAVIGRKGRRYPITTITVKTKSTYNDYGRICTEFGSTILERNRRDTKRWSTRLSMSQTLLSTTSTAHDNKRNLHRDEKITIEIDERLREENPIQYISQEVTSKMDANAILNTGVVVAFALLSLNQMATVDVGMMRGWSLEEIALRIPLDNWNSYSAVLSKAPIPTKAATSATVYAIGDFIAQRAEGRTMGELDRPRLARSLLAGLLGHGPMSHFWYEASENVFQNILHLPSNFWGTAAKIGIDQTIWGPFWNNTYILMLGVMKNGRETSFESIWAEMKRTTIPLIVSGLKLWPLAHCVTYGLIPVENRLLWVDLVEILWVTILATTAAAVDPEPTGDETKARVD